MIRSKHQCGDEGALRAGLHGNRRPGRPWLTDHGHTAQVIYDPDPYDKTTNQIHNCLVRLCWATNAQPTRATWSWESECKTVKNSLFLWECNLALRSNHRGDTVDWVADDWGNVNTGETPALWMPMNHDTTIRGKYQYQKYPNFLWKTQKKGNNTFNMQRRDETNYLSKKILPQYCGTHLQSTNTSIYIAL